MNEILNFFPLALIDMTGGIEETFQLNEIEKNSFFDKLGNSLAHDAMMVRKKKLIFFSFEILILNRQSYEIRTIKTILRVLKSHTKLSS